MTIHEIQSTLDTLRARHPYLDEALLSTLLSSGGWDEQSIREAITLFRSGKERTDTLLPEMADTHHMLTEHNDSTQPFVEIPQEKEIIQEVVPEVVKISEEIPEETIISEVVEPEMPHVIEQQEPEVPQVEPQSLIVEELPNIPKVQGEPPHNLPVRPFESTPHVWPFSRYKDVFYGEVMPKLSVPEHVEAEKQKVEHIHVEPVPLTKKDEKLIVLASTMLLIIILLLVYMYSNGRL